LNAGLLAWGQLVDFATSMQKVASDSNIIDKKTQVLDTTKNSGPVLVADG